MLGFKHFLREMAFYNKSRKESNQWTLKSPSSHLGKEHKTNLGKVPSAPEYTLHHSYNDAIHHYTVTKHDPESNQPKVVFRLKAHAKVGAKRGIFQIGSATSMDSKSSGGFYPGNMGHHFYAAAANHLFNTKDATELHSDSSLSTGSAKTWQNLNKLHPVFIHQHDGQETRLTPDNTELAFKDRSTRFKIKK